MANSLTIISKKEKEELYKDLKGRWLIELDGNKIENEEGQEESWPSFVYDTR